MSQFAPTQWTLQPSPAPDQLSTAVIRSLSRPFYGLAWGPVKSFVLGVITFGLLPLIVWPKKFHRFLLGEQRQLWHLVQWLRTSAADEDIADLTRSLRDARPVPTLWIVPALMFAAVVCEFLPWTHGRMFNHHRLLYATYLFGFPRRFQSWQIFARLHLIWVVCLSIAFASHWLHVQQHNNAVQRLVQRINTIFSRYQIVPVEAPALGFGLRPLWLFGALIGCVFNAWWAIPAALAGAVHRRYIERTGGRIRMELAQRVRMLLQQKRPAVNVPTPQSAQVLCANPLCGKPVPGGAAFCPRCGSRLQERFGAVA